MWPLSFFLSFCVYMCKSVCVCVVRSVCARVTRTYSHTSTRTHTHALTHAHTHAPNRLTTEGELPSLRFTNGWKVRGSYTTQVEKFRCALEHTHKHTHRETGGREGLREREMFGLH